MSFFFPFDAEKMDGTLVACVFSRLDPLRLLFMLFFSGTFVKRFESRAVSATSVARSLFCGVHMQR